MFLDLFSSFFSYFFLNKLTTTLFFKFWFDFYRKYFSYVVEQLSSLPGLWSQIHLLPTSTPTLASSRAIFFSTKQLSVIFAFISSLQSWYCSCFVLKRRFLRLHVRMRMRRWTSEPICFDHESVSFSFELHSLTDFIAFVRSPLSSNHEWWKMEV